MNQASENQISIPFENGSYTLNYLEWGDASNPSVLFCAHGFSRNSHDFDRLAARLQNRFRIICPDFPGRGNSGNLRPEAYFYPTYVAASLALLQHLNIGQVDWLGTSMGGIVGMLVAGNPSSSIRKLILNDVGPVFARDVMVSIAQYTGNDERFRDLTEAEKYFRDLYEVWGELPDEEWKHIVQYGTRQLADGSFGLAYDPNITSLAKQHLSLIQDADIWPVFDAIQCPVLVLRGATSPVLTADVVEKMKLRGKQLTAVEIPGVGHAPALRTESEIAIIESWL